MTGLTSSGGASTGSDSGGETEQNQEHRASYNRQGQLRGRLPIIDLVSETEVAVNKKIA
jgi:hypothetical protein